MKTFSFLALAFCALSSTTFAHDIHNRASDHTHPGYLYTHSVSSHFDHHQAHHAHYQTAPTPVYYKQPTVVQNTATYYTRNYPVVNRYRYTRPANTTIHQPPFAYSSCANQCDKRAKTITVNSTIGSRAYTYRAPSEYKASEHRLVTPRSMPCRNHRGQKQTYVSPYKRHQLTTCTVYGCQ